MQKENPTHNFNPLLIDKGLVVEFKNIFPDASSVKRESLYKIDEDKISERLAECLKKLGVGDYDLDYDWDELRNDYGPTNEITFDVFGDKVRNILEILNGNKAKVRKETLEYISRYFGESKKGHEIIELFSRWGVPDSLIEYPNTKWRMIFSVLCYYASSSEKKDLDMFYKIIGEILHPLMYGGDKEKSDETCKNFNKYLEYDGLVIIYDGKDKKYEVWDKKRVIEVPEGDVLDALNQELFEQEQEELAFLRLSENKEKISILRKAYQVFMNIAEVFCDNPSKPSQELNDAYVKTKKMITDVVNSLHLQSGVLVDGYSKMHTLQHYCIPFNNLFTAEVEYKTRQYEKLHWDEIRPKMHATYGCIDELYRKVDGSDVLSKPDVQQILNNVSLLLSKTKEENKKQTEVKKKITEQKIPVQKIEITAIPELRIGKSTNNTGIDEQKEGVYITKENDDFYYKGDLRTLSKNPDWYKVFCALYDLIPKGGEITYTKLGGQIKSKIKKTKDYKSKTMIKFIQTNLTDKSNGFMHYAGIPENEDNGKPLLYVNRGKGIIFNNRLG